MPYPSRLAAQIFGLILLFGFSSYLTAQVKYDEGRRMIDGIVLLQDSQAPLDYYYLPDAPRLATNEAGDYELLCMKFVGGGF